MNGRTRHDRGQGRVQVTAVEQEIRRAETLFDVTAQQEFVRGRTGIPLAVQPIPWRKSNAAQVRLQSQSPQHFGGVRALLDTGADAGEFAGLFVDLHLDTDAPQGRGRGEPSHAGADDRDRELLFRHPSLQSVGSRSLHRRRPAYQTDARSATELSTTMIGFPTGVRFKTWDLSSGARSCSYQPGCITKSWLLEINLPAVRAPLRPSFSSIGHVPLQQVITKKLICTL